jgi:CRP-like cAMP-binding protein
VSTTDVPRQVWLFSSLNQDQLESVSSFSFQKTFGPGELIIEEGRTGNGLYIVMYGEVEVIKGLGSESERLLARLGAGEVIGEMALLGEWPRTASVRALSQVICLGIDRWVFLTQLESHPQLGVKMLQILARPPDQPDTRASGRFPFPYLTFAPLPARAARVRGEYLMIFRSSLATHLKPCKYKSDASFLTDVK